MNLRIDKTIRVFLTAVLTAVVLLASGCAETPAPSETAPVRQQSETEILTEEATEVPEESEAPETEETAAPTSEDESETTVPTTTRRPSPSEETEETTEEAVTPEFIAGYRVKVTVPSARVRAEASLDSAIAGAATEGEVFDVKGVSGAFYAIDFGNATRYLHYSVVDYGPFEKPAPAATEPAVPASRAEYTPGDGRIIALDIGHRPEGAISGVEPIGPGASETKRKLSTGTQGTDANGTVWYERDINLAVGLKLKAILEARGYSVFLVNRNESNAERALEASASGASLTIRIHCNGSDNHDVKGLMTYSPKPGNPFLGDSLIAESQRLSNCIAPAIVAATGVNFRGDLNANDMTGTNWSRIPVTIVEMGFMTNVEECTLLASPEYQEKLALGMANGVDAYLGH